jgi:ATP-binding protein involved in chromosome partitioning
MPEQSGQPQAGQSQGRPAAAGPQQTRLEGVACVIAVSSCKGGVGKSTVAANLAVALGQAGLRVGLADVDIYGPSAPIMFGVSERPGPADDEMIPTVSAHGISLMSMGLFLDDNAPVIWRGPMAMSATRQFLRGVAWGTLDILIVDLPPGTGDIVLTLCQEIPLDGAVVVTTPQDVALADVKRGISMFGKVNTAVLGVVDNMSAYICPDCGNRDEIFGSRRPDQLAAELGLPLLGELPIDQAVRESGDAGTPIVVRDPSHPVARAFVRISEQVTKAIEKQAEAKKAPEPVEIAQEKEREIVRIKWSDGLNTQYSLSGLRGWCPCAGCQGHGGERRFVASGTPRLQRVEAVGNYAVRVCWADGHETGMYSFEYLRELADTSECKPE